MATFAYYNYQFEKDESQKGGLFREGEMRMDPEVAFQQKQDILNRIFLEDYQSGGLKLVFDDSKRKKVYGHRYLIPPTDGMVVMAIANEKDRVLETKDWKERREKEYPRTESYLKQLASPLSVNM